MSHDAQLAEVCCERCGVRDILKAMIVKLRNFVLMLAMLMAFAPCVPVKACSLALHDWKLVFYLKIPVSVPIFPMAELNAANVRAAQKPFSKVLWVGAHDFFSSISTAIMPLFTPISEKAADVPWLPMPAGPSLLSFAREANKSGQAPLIVGSDKCYLKIAFFADMAGSGCYQLVVMQNNRLRAVHPDMKSPWAQEQNGQSWFSLIFYQLPLPGRILSFSIYPVNQARHSVYEDHPYVETLLGNKLLQRRPDMVVDPYQFDFPELPE